MSTLFRDLRPRSEGGVGRTEFGIFGTTESPALGDSAAPMETAKVSPPDFQTAIRMALLGLLIMVFASVPWGQRNAQPEHTVDVHSHPEPTVAAGGAEPDRTGGPPLRPGLDSPPR